MFKYKDAATFVEFAKDRGRKKEREVCGWNTSADDLMLKQLFSN